jgi:hypothetical protein
MDVSFRPQGEQDINYGFALVDHPGAVSSVTVVRVVFPFEVPFDIFLLLPDQERPMYTHQDCQEPAGVLLRQVAGQ